MKDTLNQKLAFVHFIPNGKNSWVQKREEADYVLQLQKSIFSSAHFLNVGVFLKFMNDKQKKPKIDDCHFIGRYSSLLESKNKDDEWLLDNPENPTHTSNEVDKIVYNITTKIIPYLELFSSKALLRNNFPEKFDWNKLNIANVTEDEILKMIS